MRNFFCKCIRTVSIVYMCSVVALSYYLMYNEYYTKFHENMETSLEDKTYVYPLGEIVGIYTECDGVFVIDTCEIETLENEFINPGGKLLRTGDYILEVNGKEILEKETLVSAVNESEGKPLELLVQRGGDTFTGTVTPILGKNGKYMLGVWIKDDLAGVGTITFYTENGDFAALGHGMSDGVTKAILSVRGGDIYCSELIGIQKGKKGIPGEVKGIIYYGNSNHIGVLETNCREGIYGNLDNDDLKKYQGKIDAYEIGSKQEIEVGKAQIISDVSGERQLYDIKITYVDYLELNSNKGIYIEITDDELLELTGGIVQGMSGSPIIQNGKLIGAVTHVLVNDPKSGYGIFIENMLEHNADSWK